MPLNDNYHLNHGRKGAWKYMKAIVKISDKIKIELEEGELMGLLFSAITLTQYPKKCICGNTEGLYWVTNRDREGNLYVNVKCPKCGARAKLGSFKDKGGHFWRDFVKYVPKQQQGTGGKK